jgi:pSer/pThr/pTyr-binding forkhead associated (FHA) protein
MGIPCPRCNYDNRDENIYCTQCGTKLRISKAGLYLLAIAGPEKGMRYELDKRVIYIGRGKGNDIQINDPTVSVSHARIDLEGDEIWIEDLGSTNGTAVNGEKILYKTPLHNEYLIKLGNTLLKLCSEELQG